MTIPLRDPETGDLNFALSVEVHLTGHVLPMVWNVTNWAAARKFLVSAEFRQLADRVQFVTIHNRTT